MKPKYNKFDSKDERITIAARLQSSSLIIKIETPRQILTAVFKQEQAIPFQQIFQEPYGSLYEQISKYSEQKLREMVSIDDRLMSISVAQLERTDRKAYIRSYFKSAPSERQLQQESNLSRRMQDIEEKQLKDRVRLEFLERSFQDQEKKHLALKDYVDSRIEELNQKIAVLANKWEEANPQL